MNILNQIMNPIFALITLDILTRQIDSLLLNPNIGLKIPIVARAAMSLTFNLFRLKVSSRFTKGLPFGMGTIANFAIRISGLQIALGSLPIFFDPRNYEVPGGDPGLGLDRTAAQAPGIPILQYGTTGAFNVGDFVRVIAGSDAGRTGSIQGINGNVITVSGINNVFTPDNLTRV